MMVLVTAILSISVMPREGHGSRNSSSRRPDAAVLWSCPARGMGVEILYYVHNIHLSLVMPREGHGSRNHVVEVPGALVWSCPARGMGVEMGLYGAANCQKPVMPREGHGSRNPPHAETE